MSGLTVGVVGFGCMTKWAGTFQSTGRKPCDRSGIAGALCLFVSREVVEHDISVLLDRIYKINRIFSQSC